MGRNASILCFMHFASIFNVIIELLFITVIQFCLFYFKLFYVHEYPGDKCPRIRHESLEK